MSAIGAEGGAETAKTKRSKTPLDTKKEESALAVIAEAEAASFQNQLESELLAVEGAGYEVVHSWREMPGSPEEMARKIEQKAAQERSEYAARFVIDNKGKAAWAAKKIAEARTEEERVKAVQKAEVARAEKTYIGRKDFFEDKILEWAKKQTPDKGTKGSIRCPEALVRLQVQDTEVGGPEIIDDKLFCEELIEKIGISAAVDLGFVKLTPSLVGSDVKDLIEYVAKVQDRERLAESGEDPASLAEEIPMPEGFTEERSLEFDRLIEENPGLSFKNAIFTERRTTKKLVIVRL
jgi:hypothetical protein